MPGVTVYQALAEPLRRQILDTLRQGERPVGDLVAALGVAQPNVSKHLRALAAAGLVQGRADGRRRIYALRPQPLLELEAWLAPYREYWAQQLDRLEHHLDATHNDREGK